MTAPMTSTETHLTCCALDHLSLCGLRVEVEPWTDDDASCVVCVDMDEVGGCPLGRPCQYHPHESGR